MVGVCQLAKGDGPAAVVTFRRALASDQLTRDAERAIHYELGAAHALTGDGEVALHYFQKVAKADPAFRDVARRIAELGGGPGRAPPDDRPRPAPGGAPPRPPPVAARPAPPPGAAKKNIGYL
jgi:type IV secretory pathway TrbD component